MQPEKLPFRVPSSIGSTLRSYSSVRYIDRNLLAFQAECRIVPLWRRVGAVVFLGAGDFFDKMEDLHFNRIKFSAGIRYLFSRSVKINIRLDYRFGKNSSGDYLDLNEAF